MAWKHRTFAQEWEVVGLTNGHSQSEIAKLTGLTKGVVLEVQRKYHLTLSFGQSISSAQFRYRWDEQKWGRVIEALYIDERLSMRDVAKRCGVHVDTIRRRMAKLEIPVRAAGDRQRGTKRAHYRSKLPRCASGCGTGVKTPGEVYCAECRRRR